MLVLVNKITIPYTWVQKLVWRQLCYLLGRLRLRGLLGSLGAKALFPSCVRRGFFFFGVVYYHKGTGYNLTQSFLGKFSVKSH
jgi:hypothetical protein